MKIAHFGTFDVENYGDLLFPLLLERRLGGQEVEFVHVSPVGRAPDLKDCKPVIGFEEALADCESWDAIVFGGGALGHGESAGDVEKYRDPAIHTIAYPGLWLLPAFIAHLRGIPLVWNAPGIPGDFSEERKRQLMQWACWQADYLSVRDVQSATVLAESLVEAKVVPDPGVEVSNLWSDRELRAEIARLKRREEWPQNRYLALHLNQRYADADLVAEEIKQICEARGAVALLIAIGGCHGDEGFARRILEHLQGHQATIFVPDSLRSVAAAIRFSDGYVGSSLHGAITAYSLARPFLIVAPESRSKFSGFLAHVGAQDRQVATWAAAVEVVGHWPPSKQQTEIAGGQNKSVMEALDQHWATLSERLRMRRPASSLAGAQLLETLSQMPPEWFPFIPMLERSPLFAQVIEKYREPWNSVRRQLQNSAFVTAAAYRRLDIRHQKLISDVGSLQAKLSEQKKTIEKLRENVTAVQKTLEDRSWKFSRDVAEHKKVIEKRDRQIQEQREKANVLQKAIEGRDQQIQEAQRQTEDQRERANALRKTVERRDRQIATVQKQLNEAEDRWRKDLAKLGKWSDRLLQDYQRVLKSNRWRIGCWLSLKRADERSKEAHRLAQLIASRPRPVGVGRDVASDQFSVGNGKPEGTTGTRPGSGKRDACPTISAKKKDLKPSVDSRGKPGAASKGVERGGQLISIVIPVYNAHDDLIRCLESVQRRSRPEHPVILIDDASPDERIWPLLQHWATQPQNFRAVRNDSNLGYTATVNRGCELAGSGDIILLNSDTVVPPRWIEQMAACAYSQPGVATVTAISNAAGAFSVPRKNAINDLPPEWSVDQMAAFVERNSQRVRPVVPTGNGFCMYITSAARTAIGLFDAEHFPNGYGEENDFCLRASAAGLVNVIDDATYVFHRRSASFGPAKEETLKKSRAILDELHPEYSQLIREWNQMDALDPVRGEMQRQLDVTFTGASEKVLPEEHRPCLLFVLHDGRFGTRLTSEDLSLEIAERYRTIVLRAAIDHWTLHEYFVGDLSPVRRYAFAEPWRVDRPMTPDRLSVIAEICADYKVDLAHVRHLLASGPELLSRLRQLDIPIVFSFHDFYTICPTIQLLDETRTYCAGRCTNGAGDCPLPVKWFRPPLPRLKHRYVYEHQRRMSEALEFCDFCVTTSESARALVTQHFPALANDRFTVIEHGRNLPRLNLAKAPEPGKPLRAVFFGAFNPAKGLELILELLRRNRDAGGPIELHILGEKSCGGEPEALGAIYHGPYQRDELAERIRAIGPAVSLIPSLWPETYCHVLTESWAMGLPVVASDIGTLRERVSKHGGGWLLTVGDTEQWFAKMQTLADDQEGYAEALEEIQKMKFPDIAWMAEKYDAIYKQLLARWPTTPGSQRNEVRRLTKPLATSPQPSAFTNEQQRTSRKTPVPGKADVIVCVHNALEDVRRCLASVVKHRNTRLNKLILVNDGSDEETTSYLRQFAAEAQIETVLLEDPQPAGYTKAANRGLAAREAEYAILLNSDTIVTPGWIDRLIVCGESDPSIGIIGPLANAASWQSVPERYSPSGDWAVNELPLSSLDRISTIFSILHAPRYPRVPLVNGFCFAIKSAVIDAIGLLDEELFPDGYGEENDYCLRAGKAGFSLAIADDCYLFHAKSRSYSHETRRKLGGQSRMILHQKYGAEVGQATTVLKNSPELTRARSVFARLVDAPPCSILFLMNFRGAGGGINSIVQEADGLRKLGAAVQVAIRSQDKSYYCERFPGIARNLFHVSGSTQELISYARGFEFVVATLFKSVRTLKALLDEAPGVTPCYYVQDYEPNFFHPSDVHYQEAVESYTLIPEIRCFAKTRWLCETVAQKHGVHVHKVKPSIDRDIFFSDDRPKPGSPFVVCAMVRPVSERRSPGLTFEILRRIKREFGKSVEIRMFGLDQDDPYLGRQPSDFEYKVLGILDRQGVAKLMRESSLFIDASTYQAFGRTGLEAMACRCATILPSEGGISEYAVDGVNTLLSAPDAGDVLRKVRRYIREPQLYQNIVEQALKTASRYSIEKACASELEFFESFRQKPRPRSSEGERVTSPREPHGFATHLETWMERNELGKACPYQPTITGFDQFINDKHRYYNECPMKGILVDVGIQGKLRREDALKLYEMGYYAAGDILEFGTNRGLSISILARAVRDAGKNSQLVTMELDERLTEQARRTLSGLNLSSQIEFLVGDADISCQKLVDAGRKFHFAFVDHSHAYDDVVKACRRLSQLLTPGSFCLFHDFNTSREGTADYGVYTAVAHALDKNQFEFCGIYGCCGLFRRRQA